MRDATIKTMVVCCYFIYFNPRVPCGTRHNELLPQPLDNISIHASHAGRDDEVFEKVLGFFISIHASHAGRDDADAVLIPRVVYISIHASHAGRDCVPLDRSSRILISIHASHAGRDSWHGLDGSISHNFNPRVPCGTRPL